VINVKPFSFIEKFLLEAVFISILRPPNVLPRLSRNAPETARN
jgi:hypothetical protein